MTDLATLTDEQLARMRGREELNSVRDAELAREERRPLSTRHDTTTLTESDCLACCERRGNDPYSHGRVGNFYRRAHLRAIVEDRQSHPKLRLKAARELTHVSYPLATRKSAARAVVALTEPGIAELIREQFGQDA